MIAYEELEKALARWKSRRPGAGGVPEARAEAVGEAIPSDVEYNETPAAPTNDSTAEVELGDASIIDES